MKTFRDATFWVYPGIPGYFVILKPRILDFSSSFLVSISFKRGQGTLLSSGNIVALLNK
jgi:hypothetical protein